MQEVLTESPSHSGFQHYDGLVVRPDAAEGIHLRKNSPDVDFGLEKRRCGKQAQLEIVRQL